MSLIRRLFPKRSSRLITPADIPNHPMRGGLSRRSLLAALGLGALTYAVPLGKGRNRASAAPGDAPKRILFFYGAGMLYNYVNGAISQTGGAFPVGANGAPTPTETAWELGSLHTPLAPHKDDLLYIDGLGMVSEEIDPTEKGNAHNQGAKHALAPYVSAGTDLPGGISIDQFIAQGLNTPDPVTAFPALELCFSGWENEQSIFSGASATGPGALIAGGWDPRKNYDQIFGNFEDPGQDPAVLAAIKERRDAVFALANGEMGSLSSRLTGADKTKIDTHQDLLSDLQKQLDLTGATCQKPDKDTLLAEVGGCDFACWKPEDPTVFSRNFKLSSELNTKLAAAALACDLTRVVFFDVRHAAEPDFGYTTGAFGSTDSHDLIHKVNNPNEPASQDPTAWQIVADQCRIEAQKVADLLALLKSIPEGEGTLFDNTVVVWCSQIGWGSHDLARLPWVLCGDLQGTFKTGRYVKLPKNPKSDRGMPHNDLFVSLSQAMGLDVNSFGNPACCNGPLAGLTG
ncbi:MAG: DUF1552 domain-containing protein [Polyangiaceae bacterium]